MCERGLDVRFTTVQDLVADPVVLHHETSVTCVAFCPTGIRLASASSDSAIRVWDLAALSPQFIRHSGHADGPYLASFAPTTLVIHGVSSVAYSPDASQFASGGNDGHLRLWGAYWPLRDVGRDVG